MNVTVDTKVSYDVKNVVIKDFTIFLDSLNKLIVVVPYEWFGANDKSIRKGINQYKEADLISSFAAMNQDFAPIAIILKTLITKPGNFKMVLGESVTGLKSTPVVTAGVKTWTNESFTEVQLAELIAPLTIQQIKNIVTAFTQAVLV